MDATKLVLDRHTVYISKIRGAFKTLLCCSGSLAGHRRENLSNKINTSTILTANIISKETIKQASKQLRIEELEYWLFLLLLKFQVKIIIAYVLIYYLPTKLTYIQWLSCVLHVVSCYGKVEELVLHNSS